MFLYDMMSPLDSALSKGRSGMICYLGIDIPMTTKLRIKGRSVWSRSFRRSGNLMSSTYIQLLRILFALPNCNLLTWYFQTLTCGNKQIESYQSSHPDIPIRVNSHRLLIPENIASERIIPSAHLPTHQAHIISS